MPFKLHTILTVDDYKKGKIEELFSSTNVFVYPEKEVVVPEYNSFPPSSIAYEGRSPTSEIRFLIVNCLILVPLFDCFI